MFAYFYGMFNIYVLLLAFCYTPAGSVYGDINTNDNVRTCFGVYSIRRQNFILPLSHESGKLWACNCLGIHTYPIILSMFVGKMKVPRKVMQNTKITRRATKMK